MVRAHPQIGTVKLATPLTWLAKMLTLELYSTRLAMLVTSGLEGRRPTAKQTAALPRPLKGASIMPASLLRVRVMVQRGCPACMAVRCADPAECLYFLTSRPWADCVKCDGSGWASEDMPGQVFCGYCDGSGLNEYTPGSITPEEISDRAKERHAAYVAALRARIAVTSDRGLPRPACPGCGSERFPLWTRVPVDGMEVLTHDGETICPGDPAFGGWTGPEPLPASVSAGVAA